MADKKTTEPTDQQKIEDLETSIKTLEKSETMLKAQVTTKDNKIKKLNSQIAALSKEAKAEKEAEDEFSTMIEKVKKKMKPGQSLLVTRSGTTFQNTASGKNLAKYSKEDFREVTKA